MKSVNAVSMLVLALMAGFFAGLVGPRWAPEWLSPEPPIETRPLLPPEQYLTLPAVSVEEIRRLREGLEAVNSRVMETELRLLGLQKSIADLALSLEELAEEKRAAVSLIDSGRPSGVDRGDETEALTADWEEDSDSRGEPGQGGPSGSWFVHLGTFETEDQALAITNETELLLGARPQVFAAKGPLWSVRLCQLETQVSAQDAVNALRRARISESSWIGRGCTPR